MKKPVILTALILLSISSFAQNKIPVKASGKPEIDILYEKYKNSPTITLFTPFGDLEGIVTIEHNDDWKPVSVKINGQSSNKDAVTEFLINTIKMKMKQGYKKPSSEFGYLTIGSELNNDSFWEMVSGMPDSWTYERKTILKKGTMYFILDAVGESASPNSKFRNCYWSIETGDSKRQGGSSASKFEF